MSNNTFTGILEWPERAEGRVRRIRDAAVLQGPDDPFVPVQWGDQLPLRDGLEVTVQVGLKKPRRRRGRGGRGQARPVVEEFISIEGMDPESFRKAKKFEDLTVIDPQPRLTLEYPGCPDACRLIDLFCPIGRGTRGLIVSPPKAGKTTLLKNITESILLNHEDVHVMITLIDERPEEVTDFSRTFTRATGDKDPETGEPMWDKPWSAERVQIFASSNDHDLDKHIQVAMMTMERAKRMVEAGRHVVIVMDSLTRLGRSFNRSRRHASSGRTLSGGIDSKAMEVPRQIFGAARNTEDGGSLTIIATCLVDTGSQGDQVIFEEFKGSGNMELILDRRVAERRLFPAMDLAASGTRKEELLLDSQTNKTIMALRRRLMNMPPPQQIEQLLAAMKRFETNAQLVGAG